MGLLSAFVLLTLQKLTFSISVTLLELIECVGQGLSVCSNCLAMLVTG